MKFKRNIVTIGRIELAPMVDVVFLLVIYFLVASTLEENVSIPVNLPTSKQSSAVKPPQKIIVSINSKGKVFVGNNTKSVPISKLGDRITQILAESDDPEYLKSQVIIRGDQKTPYETIISVMDELSLRNIKNFNLSVKQKAK